jgi:hypothetical protein
MNGKSERDRGKLGVEELLSIVMDRVVIMTVLGSIMTVYGFIMTD